MSVPRPNRTPAALSLFMLRGTGPDIQTSAASFGVQRVLETTDLVGREGFTQDRLVDPVEHRPVNLVARGPEARPDEDVRPLPEQGDQFVVDRLDAGLTPCRMGEAVNPGAQEVLEILELVNMSRDAKLVPVGLIDDRR